MAINSVSYGALGLVAILCAGATSVHAQFTQQGQKLTGTGGSPGFAAQGSSVAISADGNTAIVGGPMDGYNPNPIFPPPLPTGAAWVFTRSGGVWSQQGAKLADSSSIGFQGEQGFSVALSADGNTALVGAPGVGNGPGAFVYVRVDGAWTEQAGPLEPTASSVALSADGNTALIGASSTTGEARVYTRSGSVWTQQGQLVGTGASGGARQGWSLALSADGNTALVGGPFDNSVADGGAVGAAWVFTRVNGVWSQQGGKLVGSDAVGLPLQGWSVALSWDGNTAIVGGPLDNAPADGLGPGAAWVFRRTAGVWSQEGLKLVGTGAADGQGGQGVSVSLSGDGSVALVGGSGNVNYGLPHTAGATWVFARNEGSWIQQGVKLVGSGGMANAGQGSSVSLSGDGTTALVGGPGADGAWVFTIPAACGSGTPSTRLCIDDRPCDSRFQLNVHYSTTQGGGRSGDGAAVPLSSLGVLHGGLFSFFDPDNPEMLIKVLDACAYDQKFWVFSSAATNVGMTTTVMDLKTGRFRSYANPDGAPAAPIQDTRAFDCGASAARDGTEPVISNRATKVLSSNLSSGGSPTCSADDATLCIAGRFKVKVAYSTAQGGGLSGNGHALNLASVGVDRGGLFWFFDADNPEMLVKVLDGCSANDRFWVFYSAGTNAGFTATVIDTQTARRRRYVNTDLTPARPVQDTVALPCP